MNAAIFLLYEPGLNRHADEAYTKRLSELKECMEINLSGVQRGKELFQAYDLIYNQSPADLLQVRFVLSDSVYLPAEPRRPDRCHHGKTAA